MIPLISVVAPGPTATVPEKAPAPLPPKITKLCVPIWSRGPVYPGGFRSSRPFRTALVTSSVPVFFFSSRRRHTSLVSDWSSDVCSSDLPGLLHFHLGLGYPAEGFRL